MQVHLGVVDHGVEELFHQLHVEHADLLAGDGGRVDAVTHPVGFEYVCRAAREVQRHPGEGFVHGHRRVAVAFDAALVAQRLRQGFAQGDAHVFDGVVVVDVGVAVTSDLERKPAVLGHVGEHVVKKAHAGLDVGGVAGAVQIDR